MASWLCVAGLWQAQTVILKRLLERQKCVLRTMDLGRFCKPVSLPIGIQGPALVEAGSWPKSWEFPRVWWYAHTTKLWEVPNIFLGQMEPLVVPGLHDNYEEER